MLKNISRLEHVIGDKVYHFICDQDSPLHEVKESVLEFLKFVGRVEDNAKEQAKAQAELDAMCVVEEAPVAATDAVEDKVVDAADEFVESV